MFAGVKLLNKVPKKGADILEFSEPKQPQRAQILSFAELQQQNFRAVRLLVRGTLIPQTIFDALPDEGFEENEVKDALVTIERRQKNKKYKIQKQTLMQQFEHFARDNIGLKYNAQVVCQSKVSLLHDGKFRRRKSDGFVVDSVQNNILPPSHDLYI